MMLALRVYVLTVQSGGGWDGGGVKGEKAAKPVTTICDCMSAFTNANHCIFLKKVNGDLTILDMRQTSGAKPDIFDEQ